MPISRRDFLELAAATAITSSSSRSQTTAVPKRPNIVLILADDHRWDALGCMGNPIIQTPQIDRLAREGVIFDNHFCTTPICCASRASIMLSQYAGTNGIYDFVTPLSHEQVEQTYWHQLKQAGYYVGFIGKFGVGEQMPSEAFDYWKGFAGFTLNVVVDDAEILEVRVAIAQGAVDDNERKQTLQVFANMR